MGKQRLCRDCASHFRGECPEGWPVSKRSPVRGKCNKRAPWDAVCDLEPGHIEAHRWTFA